MKRRTLIVLGIAGLAGCAEVSKVSSGEVVLKQRLVADVPDTWNQFENGAFAQTPTWTNEGVYVDALEFYVGIKSGGLIAPTPSQPKGTKPLAFRAGMQAPEVVDLFQALWTRDGGTVTIDRIEPQPFVGVNGFRFEYSRVRKIDEVRLQGVAWFAERNGELFAIHYAAPRLAFYARYLPRAEAIAKSARVRG